MNDLTKEEQFFHTISHAVIDLVNSRAKNMVIAEDKGAGDYSTQLDVDVEKLIVDELQKLFPGDLILAEEGYSNVSIQDERIWLIDPICGTNNLGKGINAFCTNIALVDQGQVVAACVIDHSQSEYFWSTGENKIYAGDEPVQPVSNNMGTKIDVDFGSVRNADSAHQKKHNALLLKLVTETNFDMISLNTSLGFAYTALGKTDGFVNIFCHPWDIAAASFLIQQAGGVITNLDGTPWKVTSAEAIAGRTPEIHKELLDLYLAS